MTASIRRRCPVLVLFSGLLGASALGQGYLTPPTAPPENPVTAEKAALGKILFWDEQLSSDGSIACGTCHFPTAGGSDPRGGSAIVHPGFDGVFGTADDRNGSPGVVRASAFGHIEPDDRFGVGAQVTARYAPSTLTAAYFSDLFWDGRAKGKFSDPLTGALVIASGGALESQSLGPILSSVEMADDGRSWDGLMERLAAVRPLALASQLPPDTQATLAAYPSYPELFSQAFGTPEITPVRLAFALATYQRTLVPDETPWDDFQRGNSAALSAAQLRGMFAFESTAACAVCHTPPLFANGDYHNLALRPSYEDPGRMNATGDPQDLGKFKTPSLRNVALRGHWFHHGDPTITDLRGTVAIYGTGVGGGFDGLDPALNGLFIPASDIDDITEFLHALTDPRVAAGTFPFDRPTLRSERGPGARNPELLGVGEIIGTGGIAPRALVTASPFLGAEDFRIGLEAGLGGTFASMRLRLAAPGGLGGPLAVRSLGLPLAPLAVSAGPAGKGYATWQFPLTQTPAMVGLAFDAQWWVRDPQAPGGVARSQQLRFTVE
ncbi:Cytochrome c551 peroxidase precursor [Planctomycetes bacterium Poly30]|uniref:Cytochrome c551 peroxidase n=1 Tax=Saltatorellus ferox TaxID=2528018 RepID=A0A518EN43_9BACT|nr:Cytochrome c551 peroxidase precursor [Planctomycetes bacterium Poly30]